MSSDCVMAALGCVCMVTISSPSCSGLSSSGSCIHRGSTCDDSCEVSTVHMLLPWAPSRLIDLPSASARTVMKYSTGRRSHRSLRSETRGRGSCSVHAELAASR